MRKAYQHIVRGFNGVSVNANHAAGIGVELVNEIRLLAKNLVVLSHEVGTNLEPERINNVHSLHAYLKMKKTKNKRERTKKKKNLCGTNGTGIRRRHL